MAGKWFGWIGERLSDPVAGADVCGGCGTAARRGGRFCAKCGKPAFPVSANEEVELPAGRTVRLAAGMLLALYDARSLEARWREQPGGDKTAGDPRPALTVVGVGGGREQVVALRPLVAWRHAVAWGPTFELVPLQIEPDSLRLLVRRVL